MSRRLTAAVLLGIVCTGTPTGLTAQTRALAAPADPAAQARDALAARIDSLIGEHERFTRLIRERDSLRAAQAAELRTDTAVIGPFLYVNRNPASRAAIAALRTSWQARAAMVGTAADLLNGTLLSGDLNQSDVVRLGAVNRAAPSDTIPAAATPAIAPTSKLFRYAPPSVGGRPDHAVAADRVMSAALTDALPRDVREWLAGGSLISGRDALVWAYRDLATSASAAVRRCFARDMTSCVVALTGDSARAVTGRTRASLLQHALELGGDGAYARLHEHAPDAATRMANAANLPLADVVASWRSAVQEARPRIHAGVGRAGFWTLIWLLGLALLAMRSTRWRLG